MTTQDEMMQDELKRLIAKRKELVERWMPELVARVGRTEEDLRAQGLWCSDFPFEGVRIEFEDGSLVQFMYAFLVEKLMPGEIMHSVAVFTEHCGYHEFLVSGEDVIGTATDASQALD